MWAKRSVAQSLGGLDARLSTVLAVRRFGRRAGSLWKVGREWGREGTDNFRKHAPTRICGHLTVSHHGFRSGGSRGLEGGLRGPLKPGKF